MSSLRPYIANPRRGGLAGTVVRTVLVCCCWLALLAAPILLVSTWSGMCREVPTAPDILDHQSANAGTEIRSSDGARIGGTRRGRRHWVSVDDIPPLLIGAFVAAEDEAFFEHHGVDPISVLRAAWINARAGEIKQGGSTITQQVAKMYVGRERSYDRKVREAMLARRIEQRYSKLEILEAYLNRIYLGAGAHGIAAAAERYFGVELHELSLNQIALIAGLTSAPSSLNPYHNPDGALERRHYVLTRMKDVGFISETAYSTADKAPLGLVGGRPDDTAAPYVVDEVRRRLRGAVDPQSSRAETIVETTANVVLQQKAVESINRGARGLGERRGDNVVLLHLQDQEWDGFIADSGALYRTRPVPGDTVAALVTDVTANRAQALVGPYPVTLPPQGIHWALRGPDQDDDSVCRPATEVLRPGDLVRVAITEDSADDLRANLVPVNDVQGALVAIDNRTGAIRSLAGGVGWDVTQFNRATRGCRQPGSAFKPVLYSQALARGWTPASMLQDLPVRYEDSAGNLIWEPRNADRDFSGSMMLVTAIARSRNLPAVKLARSLGLEQLAQHARRLGIESPMKRTDSLALGASCVVPLELTSAYSTFARRGMSSDPHLLRSFYTRDGALLLDRGHFGELAGPMDARLYRMLHATHNQGERVLSEAVGYQTNYLLQQVVAGGTGRDADQLPVPVAGKTGTTNRFDVWFMGYSFDLAVGVWLGDDRNRVALGEGESGGTSALPVWLDFMTLATRGAGPTELLENPPEGIEFVRIDPRSGLRAHPNGHGVWIPFLQGSAPKRVGASPVQREAVAADRLDRQF